MSDAPIVTVEPGLIIYRASALGGCTRALYAARKQLDPKPPPEAFSNPEGTGYFDRGHDAEDLVIDKLVDAGWTVYDRQGEYDLPVLEPKLMTDNRVIVRCYIDGKGTRPESEFEHLVEIKNFGPDNWAKWQAGSFAAFPLYAMQFSVCLFAADCRDGAFVVRNNETGELSITIVETAPRELWEIETRVLQVEELHNMNADLMGIECNLNYPCPYYYIHDAQDILDLTPVQIQLARVYHSAGKEIKRLETVRDNISKKLKDELPGPKYAREGVSITRNDGQKRVDVAAVRKVFKEAEIDIEEFTVQGDPYLRITVKE